MKSSATAIMEEIRPSSTTPDHMTPLHHPQPRKAFSVPTPTLDRYLTPSPLYEDHTPTASPTPSLTSAATLSGVSSSPKMDRSDLPSSGGGGAPIYLPNYLTQAAQSANNSTESNESIRTQVPMSYHLSGDTNSQTVPARAAVPSNSNENQFMASTFERHIHSALNPTTASWTQGNPSQYYQQGNQNMATQASYGPQGYQLAQGTQIGGAPQLQSGYPGGYHGGANPAYGGNGQYNLAQTSYQPSYNAPSSQYESRSSYPLSAPSMNYQPYQQPAPASLPSYGGSMTSSYDGPRSSGYPIVTSAYSTASIPSVGLAPYDSGLASHGYTSASNTGFQDYNSNMNAGASQYRRDSDNSSGYASSGYPSYRSSASCPSGYSSTLGTGPSAYSSNMGRPAYTPNVPSGYTATPASQGIYSAAQLASAYQSGVITGFPSTSAGPLGYTSTAGPEYNVTAASSSQAPRPGSTSTHSHKSFRERAASIRSGTSSKRSVKFDEPQPSLMPATAAQPTPETSKDKGKEKAFDPDATPQGRLLANLQFSSEPRFLNTPGHRARQSGSSDPLCKGTFTNWSDKTPTMPTIAESSTMAASRASPPKLSLVTIKETEDPFTTPARPMVNHFATSSALASSTASQQKMSVQLHYLTGGGSRQPTIQEAFNPKNLPFIEAPRTAKPVSYGVIRISNIPYSVNRAEILAFLGRNARLVDEKVSEPVHIIMERSTGKTNDCFVEFTNMQEAACAVERYTNNRYLGRNSRLGTRHVDMELSSQEALMKALFPKAKNVHWHGYVPEIISRDPNDIYNSGYQGFISHEELVMMQKHVNNPMRSPFAKDCPERPFECLISTLQKFPWYMVEHVTKGQLFHLFRVALDLVNWLIHRVSRDDSDIRLTPMLLKRVVRACIKCPAFPPAVKDDFVYLQDLPTHVCIENNIPPFADQWFHLWTIGQKPGAPCDLVLYYCKLVHDYTDNRETLSLAEQSARGEEGMKEWLFGRIQDYIQLPPRHGLLSLAEIARIEWSALEHVLKKALEPKQGGMKAITG